MSKSTQAFVTITVTKNLFIFGIRTQYFVAGPDAGAGDGEGGDRPHEAHDRRVLRGWGRGLPRRGLANWHLAGGAIPGPEASRRAHQHFQQLQVSKAITNIYLSILSSLK